MQQHFVAFWNLENLFDIEESEDRPDYLKKQLRKELAGWSLDVLKKKVSQLGAIIKQLNEGRGPDILGVCEIENENVMRVLIDALGDLGRTYAVAHADTQDKRGIDVAFLFDADKYTSHEQFSHSIQKRTATRDIFQVNLKTVAGNTLVVVGNHWPSRSGGQYQSEPFRMMAGETLAYFHERILEELGKDVAVIAMGDFNDEPYDRAVREYAQSIREGRAILNATSIDYFYNLMWGELGQRAATYYFGNQPNLLDQFWVSRSFLEAAGKFAVGESSVRICNLPELIATGDYPRPRKFGRPSSPSSFDPDGYSDHFPIAVVLEEKT